MPIFTGVSPQPCTCGRPPAPFVVFNSEARSVMWFLQGPVLLVAPESCPAARTKNSERPGRQHAYVHCRNCGRRRGSLWFWIHRDRLSRMVLQGAKTTGVAKEILHSSHAKRRRPVSQQAGALRGSESTRGASKNLSKPACQAWKTPNLLKPNHIVVAV